MLPFLIEKGDLPFANGDYIFLPDVRKAVETKAAEFEAYVVKDGSLTPFALKMGELTDDEREIILKDASLTTIDSNSELPQAR